MLKSKKGLAIFEWIVAVAWAILLAVAIFIIPTQYGDFEKKVGERAYEIIQSYHEGEKALLFLDTSVKLALDESTHSLAKKGGLAQSSCGSYQGFPLLTIQGEDGQITPCDFDQSIAEEQFKVEFNNNLNKYLATYSTASHVVFPLSNFRSLNLENGELIGTARDPIQIAVGKQMQLIEQEKVQEESSAQAQWADETFDVSEIWDQKTKQELKKLHPAIRIAARDFILDAQNKEIFLRITSGLRTFEEQDELFAKLTPEGKKVTHEKGGQSLHNYGLAFTVVQVKDDKELIEDGDHWNQIGQIGKLHKFTWGGDLKNFQDKSRFEQRFDLRIEDLVERYNAGKLVNGYVVLGSQQFAWPLQHSKDHSVIVSCYGTRHCSECTTQVHNAVDIRAAIGDPVLAIADGVVTQSDKQNNLGTWGIIKIHHKELGYSSRYLHNSRIDVDVGDSVQQGQRIGLAGAQGSAHSHVHLELIKDNGGKEDPLLHYDRQALELQYKDSSSCSYNLCCKYQFPRSEQEKALKEKLCTPAKISKCDAIRGRGDTPTTYAYQGEIMENII